MAAILDLIEPEIAPFDPPTSALERNSDYKNLYKKSSRPAILGGRGGRKESSNVPFEGAMVHALLEDSPLLPLAYAISDHSATICHRMFGTLKSTCSGSPWVKILGVPFGVDP